MLTLLLDENINIKWIFDYKYIIISGQSARHSPRCWIVTPHVAPKWAYCVHSWTRWSGALLWCAVRRTACQIHRPPQRNIGLWHFKVSLKYIYYINSLLSFKPVKWYFLFQLFFFSFPVYLKRPLHYIYDVIF